MPTPKHTVKPASPLAPTQAPKKHRTSPRLSTAARRGTASDDVARPSRPRSRRAATTETTTATTAVEETIRVRAYFLSLERGQHHADPFLDWLDAERELAGNDRSESERND